VAIGHLADADTPLSIVNAGYGFCEASSNTTSEPPDPHMPVLGVAEVTKEGSSTTWSTGRAKTKIRDTPGIRVTQLLQSCSWGVVGRLSAKAGSSLHINYASSTCDTVTKHPFRESGRHWDEFGSRPNILYIIRFNICLLRW
jgi:hypothetical protein